MVTLTSNVPECWPSMSDVGLDESLTHTHDLFPLHPLTLKSVDDCLEGVIIAPKSALTVQASLSVRTLALVRSPGIHIKVPLLMATLGAKNIRSIKPSTLYDGHWFECALTAIARVDPVLGDRIEHVDEQHGVTLETINFVLILCAAIRLRCKISCWFQLLRWRVSCLMVAYI